MIRSLTMPRLAAGTALAAIAASGSAHAGALEQVVPSTIRLLYEEGRYVEFNAVYVDPEQSGDGINVPPNPDLPDGGFFPGNTGDIFNSIWNYQRCIQGGPERPLLLRPRLRPALHRQYQLWCGKLRVPVLSGHHRGFRDLAAHRGALL